MAAGGAFKVDALIHNLKELQQEKTCLEQKLTELRSKRRDLEVVLETVNAKQAQVRDTNLKMIETLKIAQHKVLQTQTQANSLEKSNTEKRSNIAELNEKIQKENKSQLDEVKDFEKSLRGISINLNEAKQFFAEDNLQMEISTTDKEITENEEQVGTSESEIKGLEEKVNQLSLNESRGGDSSVYGVPLEDRKEIWKMLKDENNSSIRCLDSLETRLKQLADRLHQEQDCENENTDL